VVASIAFNALECGDGQLTANRSACSRLQVEQNVSRPLPWFGMAKTINSRTRPQGACDGPWRIRCDGEGVWSENYARRPAAYASASCIYWRLAMSYLIWWPFHFKSGTFAITPAHNPAAVAGRSVTHLDASLIA